MIVIKDTVYNKYDQLLDIYFPEDKVINAVFLYFHGGGLEGGSKEDCRKAAGYLTKRKIAVVSADYRMYPHAKFPDFLEDAADAVAWVFGNSEIFGGCKNVFVGGSSAGGYISMMLCFDGRFLENHDLKPTDISGYIHDSGQPTVHYNVLKYAGFDPKRIIVDERAPLYFVGLQENYSPMLFLVADNDIQNRYEQTKLLLSTLKHFEYDQDKISLQVMHGKHCEHCFAEEKDGTSVFGKIIYNFIAGVC